MCVYAGHVWQFYSRGIYDKPHQQTTVANTVQIQQKIKFQVLQLRIKITDYLKFVFVGKLNL